jgi:hypothetical protein
VEILDIFHAGERCGALVRANAETVETKSQPIRGDAFGQWP